jgi:hypothetical protein
MGNENNEANRAEEEFYERRERLADKEAKEFANAREAVLDVIFELQRRHGPHKWTEKLKSRAIYARTNFEIRLVMDGLLVLSGDQSSFDGEVSDESEFDC